MTFAEDLRAIRERAGLTQLDAASVLDVPKITYQSWERGIRTPPDYFQRLILREFGRITKTQEGG